MKTIREEQFDRVAVEISDDSKWISHQALLDNDTKLLQMI